MEMMMKNKHIGSDFDDFLREEGILGEVSATALKRVIAAQLSAAMKKGKLNKTRMAAKMNTSRAALERLLDPTNGSVTLQTLERAAIAVGRKLKIELA